MVGAGTGLGLSTVVGIVEQSGGFIRARSEPGRGSSFDVLLPASAEALEPEPSPRAARAAPHVAPRVAGTILVAEDEDMVRTLVSQMLSTAGYRVIESGGPEEAIALARAHPGPIHLLLTDLVMPEGGGRELTDRLREQRPGLPVLFMSGYSEDLARERGGFELAAGFVQKPFRHDELLRAVRRALGEAPEGLRG
jgi:CheY-like chemotaxis protein